MRSTDPRQAATVNGILWVLRTGCAVAQGYGNWNSVFLRFTRWSKLGVWDAAFETLAEDSTRYMAISHTFQRNKARTLSGV